MIDQVQKVTPDHLRRDAYLYIRQATIREELPDSGSLQRQYALRQKRFVGMAERTGDCHRLRPGQIGRERTDREGFQKLIADVSEGRVGIVLTSMCRGCHATVATGIICWNSVPSAAR